MTAPVVHLELHTGDLARATDFYRRLLGWRPARVTAGGQEYTALEMGDGVAGGVVECPTTRALWLPYVEVADAAAATERAQALGARVLLEPREGPAGYRSVIAEPAGAELAFWQPKR
jgi:predicted enzyme related to lactoylglutathione lyase